MSEQIDYTPLLKNVQKWPREKLFDRLWSCIAMLHYNGFLTDKESKRLERQLHRDKKRAEKQKDSRHE